MTTRPDDRLAPVARRQFGAFTRQQALDAGFASSQLRERLAGGLWVPLHPRVYAAGTTALASATCAVAARLHCGPLAVFSHLTAARLLGVDVRGSGEAQWLTVPVHRAPRRRPSLQVVRSRHVDGWTTQAHGQPVMNLARTMVDLAQVLREPELYDALDGAFRANALTPEAVVAAAEGLGGRAGLAMLRSVLDDYDPAFESRLEAEAGDHFTTAGLDLEPQLEVWDGLELVARLDFGNQAARMGVEIDGHRYHSSRRARGRDTSRDRALLRRGWQVWHYTTDDVRRRPAAMVREVAAELASRLSGREDRRA